MSNLYTANEELRKEIAARAGIEEDLRVAKDVAEAASTAKSQFLANMSHEIRTPMNGVLGMTELLLDSGLNERQRRFAETVLESGRSLLTVINDILDFSKIEAGKLELETIDFDLEELLGGVVELSSERARSAGLELALDIAPTVPRRLCGDPGRLRQILSNLVGNAIKFTERGRVAVRVRGTSAPAGGVVLHIEVSDTGIGIAPEAQAHIFEPFRQADGSTTRRFGGTGLGLSICKQMVELLGGRIGVSSTPGAGAVFWFEVPYGTPRPTQSAPAAAGERPAARREPEGSRREGSLLVAEDNQVNQLLARAMLAKLGWRCDVVENGREALEAVRQKSYAAVLMDCQMPVMDGFAATRAIRAMEAQAGQTRRLPIIAVTAHAMEGDSEQCLQAGMDGYVSKPYSKLELQRELERVTAMAREAAAGKLDRAVLEGIRALERSGSAGLLRRLVAIYRNNTPAQIQALRAGAASNDAEALHKTAHSLKSSSMNVGAADLSALCREIELGCKSGVIEGAAARVAAIEKEYALVEKLLLAELGEVQT